MCVKRLTDFVSDVCSGSPDKKGAILNRIVGFDLVSCLFWLVPARNSSKLHSTVHTYKGTNVYGTGNSEMV
jgi:hypothetical protein